MKKSERISLSSKGLRYKLKISFYLMSILPLLVCIYLVSQYILPHVGLKLDIVASIAVSIFIAVVGFLVLKEVFDRILSISTRAKMIAAGDLNHQLDISENDEVGDLGEALNKLTQRIRGNMDELKTYGERTTEINLGIQKRVIVLSSLLQISSLISETAKLEDILKLTVEKSRLLANSDTAYLLFRNEAQETFSMHAADGLGAKDLLEVKIGPTKDVFYKIIHADKALKLDRESSLPGELAYFIREDLKLKNTLALPVYLRGRIVAILGIGNTRENFLYSKEDIELLDIFAKQMAIAIENDLLTHSVKKLEIKDSLTGLYNEAFMRSRLQEEIKRAIVYQRPCAFILIDIDHFKKYNQNFGSLQSEAVIKKIATLIKDSVSEIDRVGRIGDDEFAVILPERNKRQAQEIAEGIRKKIEFSYSEEADQAKKITISAGVSENPLDGISAEELTVKAKELVQIAKNQGRNHVVSFKEN
ncbi:MAG: diguanylate cyclase [Candidatus Omnitrophica bacterium]|nr:diguanylate cyclase [Candidatus Omnitrophota bacterium]